MTSSRHMKSDRWVAKSESRELVRGQVMVDDFSAKEFYKFVARAKRKKGIGNVTKFLTHLLFSLNRDISN